MLNELKPCPFCGGEATIGEEHYEDSTDDNEYFYIGCDACRFGLGPYTNQDEAVTAWNRRTKEGTN